MPTDLYVSPKISLAPDATSPAQDAAKTAMTGVTGPARDTMTANLNKLGLASSGLPGMESNLTPSAADEAAITQSGADRTDKLRTGINASFDNSVINQRLSGAKTESGATAQLGGSRGLGASSARMSFIDSLHKENDSLIGSIEKDRQTALSNLDVQAAQQTEDRLNQLRDRQFQIGTQKFNEKMSLLSANSSAEAAKKPFDVGGVPYQQLSDGTYGPVSGAQTGAQSDLYKSLTSTLDKNPQLWSSLSDEGRANLLAGKLPSADDLQKIAGAYPATQKMYSLKVGTDNSGQPLYNVYQGGNLLGTSSTPIGDIQSGTAPSTSGSSSGSTITDPSNGQTYDFSTYVKDPAWATGVNTSLGQIGTLSTPADITSSIAKLSPNSPITADMVNNAAGNNKTSWELPMAIMQHESSMGTSPVAKANNNPGGITWSQTYQDSHPGVTKGTARPAVEGGNYVKFSSMADGVNATAEQVAKRIQKDGGQVTADTKNESGAGYKQYGLLAKTDFNPKNTLDKQANFYLTEYLKNGKIPAFRDVFGYAQTKGAKGSLTDVAARANDLFFNATGFSLSDETVLKGNKTLINANNKLENNLNIQEGTVGKNFALAIQNLDKNSINQEAQPINAFLDNIKNLMGNPGVATYLTQNATLQNEVGNLIAVKNASGTTVADKLASAGLIPKNATEDQQKSILKILMQEANNGLSTIKSTSGDLYKQIDPLEQLQDNPNRQDKVSPKTDVADVAGKTINYKGKLYAVDQNGDFDVNSPIQ